MRFGKQKDFPKMIRVGNATYKVVFRRKGKIVVEGKECWGCCDTITKTIEVEQGLDPSTRLDTFVHEFLHAVEYEEGVKLEHRIIDKIEAPIARLLAGD